jgi:L-ascorbate metabolism protein UlaG (beta-lactamase superfamily)
VGARDCNGYVIQAREVAAYFAGATGYFSGFLTIGEELRPDVALLPIAGYEPDELRDGNLSPLDALFAFEDLRARFLIPIAHGTFPLGYEPPDEPLTWLRALAAQRALTDRIAPLAPGEVLRISRADSP